MKIPMKILIFLWFRFYFRASAFPHHLSAHSNSSNFVHRPRSVNQPFLFLSDPPPLKMRFSHQILSISTLFAIALLPKTQLVSPILSNRQGDSKTGTYVINPLWESYTVSLFDDTSIGETCECSFPRQSSWSLSW